MAKNYYPQAIKDEAVIFSERGHTFAEPHAKYGMAESTFFEWKKFDQKHPLPDVVSGDGNAARKTRLHLEKRVLEWESNILLDSWNFGKVYFLSCPLQTILYQ